MTIYDRENRPDIVGPDAPLEPYPMKLDSTVIPGYGRGSSDLGFPTANIPQQEFEKLPVHDTGIYYGWAKVYENVEKTKPETNDSKSQRTVEYNYGNGFCSSDQEVHPMVMSVGWNPFYGNQKKSAEVYIINEFKSTKFYGAKIKLVILGYIRPELNYVSKDALINDINTDVKVTLKSLDRPDYVAYKQDEFFV